MHAGSPDQITCLVYDAAPKPASFPVAVIGCVRSENQQQAKCNSDQRMEYYRNANRVHAIVPPDYSRSPQDAHSNTQSNFPNEGAANIEQMIKPSVGIVMNHGNNLLSIGEIANSTD